MIADRVAGRAVVNTSSPSETRALARSLASVARRGDHVELQGELGAGKTEFAKGFAEGLGIREVVNSPTFTLMAEYVGRLPLYHIDLYRLGGAADAFGAGVVDERHASGVTLIEWPDRLGDASSREGVVVQLTVVQNDRREIGVSTRSEDYERYVSAARSWRP